MAKVSKYIGLTLETVEENMYVWITVQRFGSWSQIFRKRGDELDLVTDNIITNRNKEQVLFNDDIGN